MTEEELLSKYSATPQMTEEELLKKYKAKEPEEPLSEKAKKLALTLGHNLTPAGVEENAKGIATAAGDMALGGAKFAGQLIGTLGGAADQVGNKIINGKPAQHTIKELWDESGRYMEDKIGSLGTSQKTSDNPAYKAMMTPFRVAGELAQEGGEKVKDLTGSGDAQGLAEILGNTLAPGLLHEGAKGIANRGAVRPGVALTPEAIAELKRLNTPEVPPVNDGPGIPEVDPAEAVNYGPQGFNNIKDQLAPGAELPPEPQAPNPWQNTVDELANAKARAAQAAIDARQAALEQEVKQRTTLDRNAAERARQGNAPTGYAEWLANKQREEAFQQQLDQLHPKEEEVAPAPQEPVQPLDPMQQSIDQLRPAQEDSRAMGDATRDITYENIPPDGVIPRSKAGMEIPRPRPAEWGPADEAGNRERLDLPQVQEPAPHLPDTVQGILNQHEGARNDLGNAIQEANGPKLGPDEHWGAGGEPMGGPTPLGVGHGPLGKFTLDTPTAPFSRAKNAPIRRSSRFGGQRGAVDPSVFIPPEILSKVKDWIKAGGATDFFSLHRLIQHVGLDGHMDHLLPFMKDQTTQDTFDRYKERINDRRYSRGSEEQAVRYEKDLAAHLLARYIEQNVPEVKANHPKTMDEVKTWDETHPRYPRPGDEALANAADAGQALLNRIKNRSNSKFGGGQRGAVDPQAFTDFAKWVADNIKKAGDIVADAAAWVPKTALKPWTVEDHMRSMPGMKDNLDGKFARPLPGHEYAEQAAAEGPNNPSFGKTLQSGADIAAKKWMSSALQGVARWLQFSDFRSEHTIRNFVKPLERMANDLHSINPKHLSNLMDVMKEEMNAQREFSPAELAAKGLHPKALELRAKMREFTDHIYDMDAKGREMLGEKPVEKLTAHMASLRYGDWSIPVYGKNGRLIAHVQETTRGKAKRALKHILQNPEVDADKTTILHRSDINKGQVPQDIIGAYQRMLEWLGDDPTATLIQDKVHDMMNSTGESFHGQRGRHMEKNFIPGFEGDKPWKSPEENAKDFFGAQFNNFRGTVQWAHKMEALKNIKEIVADPTLNKMQPNFMKYGRMLVEKELGKNMSWFQLAEQDALRGIGVSKGSAYGFVNSLKSIAYLTQLGISIGYAIAAPLQAMLAPANHAILTTRFGLKPSSGKALLKTVGDSSGALMKLIMEELGGGVEVNLPKGVDNMSPEGKRMYQYMHDNGFIHHSFTSQDHSIGKSKLLKGVKDVVGRTVSFPEQVGRIPTFISFAHRFLENGYSEAEAFRNAAEWTDVTLTGQAKRDRPMLVDKAGLAGTFLNMYHSFLFNAAHQLSLHTGEAMRGRVRPLVTHLGAYMALGGGLAFPFVSELDTTFNFFKEGVAKFAPQHYEDVQGPGIKGAIINDLPTWAARGVISNALDAQMSTRFAPTFFDPTHPLDQFTGLAGPLKNAGKLVGSAATLNGTNVIQGLHDLAPPLVKGQMETRMQAFRNDTPQPPGVQAFRPPSHIADNQLDVLRSDRDTSRRALGLTSISESNLRDNRAINAAESLRTKTASKNLIAAAVQKIMNGDAANAKVLVEKAIKLNPESGPSAFNTALQQAAYAKGMTPEARDAAASGTDWLALMRHFNFNLKKAQEYVRTGHE